jgi:CRISPR system Cascade subunit CasA
MTLPLDAPATAAQTAGLHHSLLDERLLHYRHTSDGQLVAATLPELFSALTRDEVRDFPALRPHQRHPWHAFLTQLAAIALHQAGQAAPWTDADAWRRALLALTPDQPDGAAWCLVAPANQPALLQPPVPEGHLKDWKNRLSAADELDMLVTSKNHDLKAARMQRSTPEDWLHALLSLQTQEGFLGAGNYGISRMNGGFASRPAVGVVPTGGWGRRWRRDVQLLLANRADIARVQGLNAQGGLALVWLQSWDGLSSLSFAALDPFYIEVCRRVRLVAADGQMLALCTGTKAARIAGKERNGVTGDAWTPIDTAAAKALTITDKGFDYKLATELLLPGSKYQKTLTQQLLDDDGDTGIVILAQGVTRGQGKTEGYHERRIPISRTMRVMLRSKATDALAQKAKSRIHAISEVRKVLWVALCVLFENGMHKDNVSSGTERKAKDFSAPFERHEDARFFLDLIEEIESPAPDAVHAQWLLALSERAEQILKAAFDAGPRSGMQRYRAQSAALGRFHGGLRTEKFGVQELSRLLRERSDARRSHEHDAQEVHHELG